MHRFIAATVVANIVAAEFSYDCATGPEFWAVSFDKHCNGTSQSPVNVDAKAKGYHSTKSFLNQVSGLITTGSSDYSGI